MLLSSFSLLFFGFKKSQGVFDFIDVGAAIVRVAPKSHFAR